MLRYASHNTFTYHKPKFWLLNLFRPFAVCQTKNLHDQIVQGVDTIDLRLLISKTGRVYISHGLYVIKPSLSEIVKEIKNTVEKFVKNKFYIRVLLENTCYDKYQEKIFIETCNYLKVVFLPYKNIRLFGGTTKDLQTKIYTFTDDYKTPIYSEVHASVGFGPWKEEQKFSKWTRFVNKMLSITPYLWELYNRKRKRQMFKDLCSESNRENNIFVDFV